MRQNMQTNLSPRVAQLAKYNTARMNLLLVVVFTLINLILGLTGSGTYFLFSAFIPYYLVLDGMFNVGKMPDDWYEVDKSTIEFFDLSYLIVMLAIAVVILVLYFVFWLLSKNQKGGFFIAALVLFSLDTLAFLLMSGIALESILDILFHAWVLYYLIVGIVAANRLKELPPDEEELVPEIEGEDYFPESVPLKNGKAIEKVGANYYRGREAVGGMLYFYRDRLVFRSHSVNIQTGNTTIFYTDMTGTEAQKNLGFISNVLLIFTADGATHRFVIYHRDEVKAYIDGKIPTVQGQTETV